MAGTNEKPVQNQVSTQDLQKYGPFAQLVSVLVNNYTQANADGFKLLEPPVYITPYNKWTVEDCIKLHDTFPKAYVDLLTLAKYYDRFKNVSEDRLKTNPRIFGNFNYATQALKALTDNGDINEYADMVIESDVRIKERPKALGKGSAANFDAFLPIDAQIKLTKGGVVFAGETPTAISTTGAIANLKQTGRYAA